jgi:hypothetical protein
MERSRIIDKILNDVCLDERIYNGIFEIQDNVHMEVLREYLVKQGITENDAKEFSNVIVEKGQYPERQAYNAKGILVTFPTPDYKQDAIKAGTHFENDPTKAAPNIFGGEGQAAEPSVTPPPSEKGAAVGNDAQAQQPKDQPEPKTSLPVSQASIASTNTDPDNPTPNTSQVKTTAAPQQTPASTTQTEPVKEPSALPPPPVKSPEEKEADKKAIKLMLRGDDYMLEQVIDYIYFNGHDYLLREIQRKIYEGQ